MSTSYVSRFLPLTAALIVAAVGCQEAPDGVTGPLDVSAHHAPDHAKGKGGDGGGGQEAQSVVDLSGGFSTTTSQPVDYEVTGRSAGVLSREDITLAVDGLTTDFDADACDWTSNLDASTASDLWTEGIAQFAVSRPRWLRYGVDFKTLGEPSTGNGARMRHREPQFGWEFRVGTLEDLLGSIKTIGTFVDNGATREMMITGGAIRIRKTDCGEQCTVHSEQFAVACPNDDAFTATVTPG
ncbi:MAG: hypothetical protein R3195_14560 [Gemmatimonadota bacterium]|nr:hypothetical protein [Gemmatimonadota bacterium]